MQEQPPFAASLFGQQPAVQPTTTFAFGGGVGAAVGGPAIVGGAGAAALAAGWFGGQLQPWGYQPHQFQLPKKVIGTPESWHDSIDANEFLRLESELEEEKKKWTDYNNPTSLTDAAINSTTVESECSSSTGSTPAPISTAPISTPALEIDLERISAFEFRRLVVRLLAASNPRMCLTPEMIQCISNLIDDIAQYILTYSATTQGTSSNGQTTNQIRFHHSFEDGLHRQFYAINDRIAQIRANYSQNPNEPGNWCRSTYVTKTLVDRWYERFQIVSPKPIPADLLAEVERAVLGGLIESTLTNLTDCLGLSQDKHAHPLPSFVDLFKALNSNNEPSLCNQPDSYLTELAFKCVRIQFDVNSNRPLKWIPLDQYSKRTAVTYYDALKLDHQDSMDRMNQLNRRSWYMQPEKLLSYAQQFVRGQLRESSSIKQLRSYGIRPLQFFVSKTGRVTSFNLTDTTGRTYPFVYESTFHAFDPRVDWRIRSQANGSLVSSSQQFTPSFFNPFPDTTFQSEFQFVLTPAERLLFEQWKQFNQSLITIKGMIKEEEETEGANNTWFRPSISTTNLSSSSHTSSLAPHATPTPSNFDFGPMSSTSLPSAFGSPNSTSTFGEGYSLGSNEGPPPVNKWSAFNQSHTVILDQIGQLQQQWKRQKCERLFSQIEPLTRFSLFGPTIYKENHPIEICRLFHSHVMDTALIDSGIQPLPRVLNELISQYACIDLPFIEVEAHQQMSSYSPYFQLAPQSQNGVGLGFGSQFGPSVPKVVKAPAAGSYPGRTNNPLETIPKSVRRCGGYHLNATTHTMEVIKASPRVSEFVRRCNCLAAPQCNHTDVMVEEVSDNLHWV